MTWREYSMMRSTRSLSATAELLVMKLCSVRGLN